MGSTKEYDSGCTFCIYNENEARLSSTVVCRYRDEGTCNIFSKNKYKCIDKQEADKLMKLIETKEELNKKSDRAEKIGVAIAYTWLGSILVLAFAIIITGLYFRFTHIDLTETQLFIAYVEEHGLLLFLFIADVLSINIFKNL